MSVEAKTVKKEMMTLKKDKATILLIEDDRALRRTLRGHLERHGLRVAEAQDGREALQKCQNQQFAVVICDVSMPRMGGGEFLEAFRRSKENSEVPVVLLSGTLDHEIVSRLKVSNIAKGFVKPTPLDLVAQYVKTLVKP